MLGSNGQRQRHAGLHDHRQRQYRAARVLVDDVAGWQCQQQAGQELRQADKA